MQPPFTISRAQLAALSRPPHDQQRSDLLLEMAALWMLYEEKWRPRFVCTLTYEERKEFFGQVYDWGMRVGLGERSHLLAVAVLLLRAVYYGWPDEDLALARGFVEADADEDPEPAIEWLEHALEQ